MSKLDQTRMPIRQALLDFEVGRVVPFDMPGHRHGHGNPELTQFLGECCMQLNVNSIKPLDNLYHPVSIIREVEELAADAFGAAHAFSMANGTTSAVQAMVLSACKHGDEIILPHNVRRSVINALILCGATPVYVNPKTDHRLGTSLRMRLSAVEQTIREHPKARTVLVNNPAYYGICSNLKAITELAHQHDMLVLADEAHGTHLYSGEDLPLYAVKAGTDTVSVSIHKSGDSLTQSLFLLVNGGVSAGYIRQVVNLTQTTSGSYLLLSGLDISRKELATEGKKIFHRVVEMAGYARDEINRIGDYYAYSRELINGDTVYDFDTTKLSINTLRLGLAGIEVYDILYDRYDTRMGFGDPGNILAYLSVGDRHRDLERLVGALVEIHRNYKRNKTGMLRMEYISPVVAIAPQKAFYAEKEALPLAQSPGRIYNEFVMCHPPGIPILAPGELITGEILGYIEYTKEKSYFLIGPEDLNLERLNVIKKE